MKHFFFVATLLVLLSIAGRAKAGMTFDISGQIGSLYNGSASGFEGGSFTGSVTICSLPSVGSVYVDSFSVTFTSPSGTPTPFTIGATATYGDSAFQNLGSEDQLLLIDNGASTRVSILFDSSTGDLIPNSGKSGSNVTYFGIGQDLFTSGSVSLPGAVPEPSSLMMVSLAGAIGLGVARLRRRKTPTRA